MTKLTIRWPDEHVERLEAARGRLEIAGRELAARALNERTECAAVILERWRDPGSPERKTLLDVHPQTSGFARATLEAGLALGLEPYTGDALRAVVERELAPALASGARLAPFATTSLLLAGAIPMPALLQILLSLVVGSPLLVRPSARDRVSAEQVSLSIAAVDPELGRAVEIVDFPSDDLEAMTRFCAAPCVVASGDDETIGAIRARLDPRQRFVAYAHRLSIAVAGDRACLGDAGERLARDLSLDVALWDQLGCLSPTAVYVVGDDADRAAQGVGGALAAALAEREAALPRGEIEPGISGAIATARSEAEMRVAAGGAGGLYASAGTRWTVVVEPGSAWRASPLHRFVRVHAVPDAAALRGALADVHGRLSSVALAGFEAGPRAGLEEVLAGLGASRFCAPGRMQAPELGWHHDGMPILTPLVGFADLPYGAYPNSSF